MGANSSEAAHRALAQLSAGRPSIERARLRQLILDTWTGGYVLDTAAVPDAAAQPGRSEGYGSSALA